MEGGSWDSYTLTQQARQLLQDEPLMAGHVRRDELHSARTVVRAAALVTATKRVTARAYGCVSRCSPGLLPTTRPRPNSAAGGPLPPRPMNDHGPSAPWPHGRDANVCLTVTLVTSNMRAAGRKLFAA
jgi:hypothetical protein